MQLEVISASRPFLLPDPHRDSAWKGLDRLQVTLSTSPNVPSSSDWTLETALAKLSEAGLACRHVPGDQLRILGGLSSIIKHGMTIYEYPFAINEEPDGRFGTTIVSARGFHDEALSVPTLEDAATRIVNVYHRRGMVSAARQS